MFRPISATLWLEAVEAFLMYALERLSSIRFRADKSNVCNNQVSAKPFIWEYLTGALVFQFRGEPAQCVENFLSRRKRRLSLT